MHYDLNKLRTPCYLIDLGLLKKNLDILSNIQKITGCRILLALKAYSAWSTFGICSKYLAGSAVSSLHEAKLSHEFFPGEIHLCAPAYRDDEFDQYLEIVDHIVFNSHDQWQRFRDKVATSPRSIECGLRINPQHSEVKTSIYDPCRPGSRLGTTIDQIRPEMLDGITGMHFHTLCELNSDSLERTLAAAETKFSGFFRQMKWVNFGGGHHITRKDYDIDLLISLITRFQEKYDVQVYLEPGEAIALNTGVLVCSVLDIMHNENDIAILDTSASAHMPDVLEMPYRPEIINADLPGRKKYTYNLSGPTCLAGDVIGDYSFDKQLQVGDKLVLTDMILYTMVKNTMFNGINLPDIVLYDPENDTYGVQRRFEYEDFKSRLS